MIYSRDYRQWRQSLQGLFLHYAFIASILACAAVATAFRVSAATITVPPGGDLQGAINAAQAGDTIILQAGATYIGAFGLPNKQGSSYITIQTSSLALLPSSDQRVTPEHAGLMAKVLSPGLNEAVISTAPYAHHYQLIGIELAPVNATVAIGDLIKIGDGSGAQNSLDQVPHDVIIDRCYIHGWPTQNVKRGVALNSGEASIINSYISDIHGDGYDTQAICGWNGPGPYHIINNYLEAAGENVMFGGADPAIPNLTPSDIEIRRNYFFKPLSWKVGYPTYAGKQWTIKNLIEMKNARRVIIDGNRFENNWTESQTGYGILLKSMNQDGGCPWCLTEDLAFTNNVIISESGLNLSAYDPYHLSGQMKRLNISNNLWIIEKTLMKGSDGLDGLQMEHNTVITQEGNENNTTYFYGRPTLGFVCRNNLFERQGYGFKGDSTAEGTATLDAYTPGWVFEKNALVGANFLAYPGNNLYPAALGAVGFVDPAGGNYRLAPDSLYRNAGTDGRDIGVDFDALNAAAGGFTPSPTPTPTPTSTPTATPTPAPVPTPSPTPSPITGIPVGTRVSVDINGVFLRSGPSVLNSVVGLQNTNILGTNTASCVQDSASTKIFCNIDFDTDPDGWAPTEHLVVGSISTATPLPPPTSSSTTVGSAFDNFVQLDTTTQDNLEGCLRGRRLRYCQ